MKIVQINSTCGAGSTGKICVAISELLNSKGVENYIFYTLGKSDHPNGRKYMSKLETKAQALKSRIFGNYGFQAKSATKRLIKELERIQPDIVHLHNIHSHNAHLGLLFNYLKEKKTKVFWTFHDCWAFTGYCPHYDMVGCDKWKNGGCGKCIQKKYYSWLFDKSRYLYEKKRELLQGLDLTIITPSQWLADQVAESFLKDCPIKVINNGIDLSVFYPRESDFRERYGIGNRFIVLGVAFDWGVRKGLDVFIELSKRLDERYQIVLVGTNDRVDKLLPDNIISIHRTNNQAELAEIYTTADVFVNPTREENFPTTHMEALACGTPVVAFNTGGCGEMLNDKCGAIVEKNNVDELCVSIHRIYEKRMFDCADCIEQSQKFNSKDKFEEYINLYI